MIAALYSSRPSGSRSITLDGTVFGWETIQRVFTEEMEKAEMGMGRKVPGLKYVYVYRDNWTCLNVRPAKIMQVSLILILDSLKQKKKNSIQTVAFYFIAFEATIYDCCHYGHRRTIRKGSSQIFRGL